MSTDDWRVERWLWFEARAHARWDAQMGDSSNGVVVAEGCARNHSLFVYYRADHLRTCENIPNSREFPLLFQQFNPNRAERRQWVLAPREVLPSAHGTVSDRWPFDPDTPHTDDWRCNCHTCRTTRAARHKKASRADRRHAERHMVDPDYTKGRKR